MITVEIPYHLQTLAGTGPEVALEIKGPATLGKILDKLESQYPMLKGTIRDHITKKRRPMIRFFACGKDYSDLATDQLLPDEVASGKDKLLIIGAIAGG